MKVLDRQHIHPYIVICIVFIFIILRLINLSADTPVLQLFTDEGFKTFDARNKLLSGNWNVEPHPPCYLYLHPVYTLCQYLFMSFTGVGYIQARLVSVLFSVGILLLLLKSVSKYFNKTTTLLAGVLLGFNHYFIMISRTAVIEVTAIFFIMLSIYLVDSGSRKQQRFFYFAAGFTVLLAVCTKLYAIFLIPLLITFLTRRKSTRDMLSFSAGLLVAALIYCVLWIVLTDLATFYEVIRLNVNIGKLEIMRDRQVLLTPTFQSSPIDEVGLNIFFKIARSLAGRLIYLNHLFTIAPAIFMLCATYYINYIPANIPRKITDLEFLCSGWLIFGGIILNISRYTSFHHLLIILPPMVILSISVFADLFSDKLRLLLHKIPNIHSSNPVAGLKKYMQIRYLLAIGFAFIFSHQIIYSLLMIFFKNNIDTTPIVNPNSSFNAYAFLWCVVKNQAFNLIQLLPRIDAWTFWRSIATGISFICVLILLPLIFRRLQTARTLRLIIRTGFILFVAINIWRYVDWAIHPQFSQKAASIKIGQLINKTDFVIGGQFLGLENELHFSHHHENLARYQNQAEYLIELIYHPLKGPQLPTNPPGSQHSLQYITNFSVCDHTYHLYKLKK